jgi:hypothetical protein
VADRSRRFAEEIRNRAEGAEPAESAGAAEPPTEPAAPSDDETAGA